MTPRKDASPAAVTLGAALRLAMRISGFSQYEIARRLGLNASTVSRLLSGTSGGHRAMVRAFLAHCTISDAQREGILALSLPCRSCGCPGDHVEEQAAEERTWRPMAKLPKETRDNLRQAAGQHIVQGKPIEAQRIQRAIQRAEKEPDPR